MGQIIKPVCVCQCRPYLCRPICLCALSRSHFFIDFHQNWHRRKNPQSFIFSSLWSKSESQLSNYYVVCKISWCRCQQLTALSISTALVTKLLVIEQLLQPALKFALSTPCWKALPLLATNPGDATAEVRLICQRCLHRRT